VSVKWQKEKGGELVGEESETGLDHARPGAHPPVANVAFAADTTETPPWGCRHKNNEIAQEMPHCEENSMSRNLNYTDLVLGVLVYGGGLNQNPDPSGQPKANSLLFLEKRDLVRVGRKNILSTYKKSIYNFGDQNQNHQEGEIMIVTERGGRVDEGKRWGD